MKKITLFSALIALAGLSMGAATASSLRVYINPGHGSFGSNDRPMTIIKEVNGSIVTVAASSDTAGFYESNTDLQKGFGMLQKLIQMGLKFDASLGARNLKNNIVMSRVKNGGTNPGTYNRNLSEIASEVNSNNFDMFVSIHSDAATEGTNTNRPTFLYRGWDSPKAGSGSLTVAIQNNSKAMAQKAVPYYAENTNMGWSSTPSNSNIRGDLDFYKSSNTTGYLGVLKHNAPGYLAEGFFHTYQPARQRAMNWDVDYIEGAAHAHACADYFGIAKESKGDIYGIARSASETFSHTYYKPNSSTNDTYKPLNNLTVNLTQNGKLIKTYKTDNYYNGAFVFKDLAPGTYQITFVSSTYGLASVQNVTVNAGKTSYVNYKLSKGVTNPDPVLPPEPDEEISFVKAYSNKAIEGLSGKTIRRVVAKNDKVYILAINSAKEPTIVVYDPVHQNILANVSTTGMSCAVAGNAVASRLMKCSDIQVTDEGVLLATNLTETTDLGSALLTVYEWENDANGIPTGNPKAWLQTNKAGFWYNSYSGETFAYYGTQKSGYAYISSETTGSTGQVRVIGMPVAGGSSYNSIISQSGQDVYCKISNGGTMVSNSSLGADFRFTMSPIASNSVVVTGSGSQTTLGEFRFINGQEAAVTNISTYHVPAHVVGHGYVTNNNKHYAVVPTFNSQKVCTGISLVNVTAGMGSPLGVTAKNTAIENNAGGVHTDGYIDSDGGISLVAVRDGGYISFFQTKLQDGIDDIEADSTDAPAVFYNLQGVEVPAENLVPGIYVKVCGSTATKVVVR